MCPEQQTPDPSRMAFLGLGFRSLGFRGLGFRGFLLGNVIQQNRDLYLELKHEVPEQEPSFAGKC